MIDFKKIKESQFFAGSLVMIIGTNAINFLVYLYHLFFGRILGPSLYGELASILAVIGFVTALVSFSGVVVVRFVSIETKDKLPKLFAWLERTGLIIGVFILLSLFLLSPTLASALSTSKLSSVQLGPIMFFSFFGIIYTSFLQGLFEFKKFIYVGLISWTLRFVLGYILFVIGFSLPGVVFAILISSIVSFFLGRSFIKVDRNRKDVTRYSRKIEIIKYSLPVFVMTVAAGSFITSDVVLVRYFLPDIETGYYAALSSFGKIIVFASAPVSAVMFPIVSKSFAAKLATDKVFLLSSLATVLISTVVLFIYRFFPNLAIGILYGSQYLSISSNLTSMGVLFSIYTLDLLMVNYHLSKSKTIPSYFILLASLLQVIGIILFHSSISQIILVSTTVAGVLLAILATYSFWEIRDRF